MNDYQYEPLGPADLESMLAMRAELYVHEEEPYDGVTARRTVLAFLDRPELGGLYAIRAGTQMVGYLVLTYCASLEFGGQFVLLDELFVGEAWRGKGIGSRTLEFVVELCRARGIAAARLEVDRSNVGARELYRLAGFREHDRVLMTKRL